MKVNDGIFDPVNSFSVSVFTFSFRKTGAFLSDAMPGSFAVSVWSFAMEAAFLSLKTVMRCFWSSCDAMAFSRMSKGVDLVPSS
jgi:hypothetical protein